MATFIRDGATDSAFASVTPAQAGTYIRGAEWGIDNTLSGFIVQSEDISEETVTDVTQDQKGAVVSEMEYDKKWNLTLGVIGDSSATLPEVGDITFTYGGHKWKVDSVTYTGGYQDKKKYSIQCHRALNWPSQS